MILAITGLRREARILAGPGVTVIAGGGDRERLAREIEAVAPGARAIISIGLAGALKPGLRPGNWVVASKVIAPDERYRPDPAWTEHLGRALRAVTGDVLGCDEMVADVPTKLRLREATGAIAVDMESHVAAEAAARHGLPFAVARAISDASDRALPRAAQAGMAPDGRMDVMAVLKALAARPWELPALIRTGIEAEAGFGALLRGRQGLGATLGLAGALGLDLGELPLDVA